MACHRAFQEREFLYRLLKAGTPKSEIARRPRRSLTLDNGKQFAEHRRRERALGLDIYLALP
jgi:hypothetical protein